MQRLYRMIYSKREHKIVAFLQQLERRSRKRKVVLALHDIILDSYVTPWDSPLYHDKGKPLPYITPFIPKLKSIDKDHTLLTIEALYPEIFIYRFYWEQCNSCGIDVMDLRTKKVKPTTIEEHALLLYIADKLGDKTVEPLKLPAP